MDYKKTAQEIYEKVGKKENLVSAAHCATRLRLIVADRAKADDEKVGEIDAVKGTFFTAGQYQIIFGTGHVNRVYEQITQLGIAETTASEAKEGAWAFVRTLLLPYSNVTGWYYAAYGGGPASYAGLAVNRETFEEQMRMGMAFWTPVSLNMRSSSRCIFSQMA